MSEKITVWCSAQTRRFDGSSVRQHLGRCLLLFACCFPVAATYGDDRPREPLSDFQGREISTEIDESTQSSTQLMQIDALIELLDANTFAQREHASLKLAAIGEPVIGPLAYHSFHCSPETGWRIKKTLEKICTDGTEAVFFKAVAILNLRFNVGGSDSPALAQSLATLESKWRKKRKSEAITKLRVAGATVNDPYEDLDVEVQQIRVWQGANLFRVNGEAIDIAANSSSRKNALDRAAATEKLTEKELRKKIKTILDAGLDENRQLVFGDRSAAAKTNNGNPDFPRNVNAQIAIQNQIRANQLLMGRQPGFSGTGVTIALGDNWQGDSNDLQLLNDVENLQLLSFVNQSIREGDLRNIANVDTLTKLVFDNCEFVDEGLENLDWKSLSELEFKNQTVTGALIKYWSSIETLRSVTFSECEMKPGVLGEFSNSKNLRMLQFDTTEIDDTVFEILADLTQVNFVNLNVCKFNTKDYKILTASRPNLQIAFTAQAFFGVRGPVNTGLGDRIRFDREGNRVDLTEELSGVLISDVIADSGAANAGIKVGDVIESVDGQTIEKFEDLRLQIAQHRAGDKLEVIVRREKEPVKLQVELGSQKSAPRF